MVRTQIQLTERQVKSIRSLAKERRVSMAEIIRQSIEAYLKMAPGVDMAERKRRAIAIAGRFRSNVPDLGTNHDRYLTEAYDQQ